MRQAERPGGALRLYALICYAYKNFSGEALRACENRENAL